MKLATLMSSALIACTSVKAGPRVSRSEAAKLNGPRGTGAVRTGPMGPAVRVVRKGVTVAEVSHAQLMKGAVKP